MGIFAEGIESLKLACSLVLLVPALGVALMGRRRVWLVPAWIVTVTLITWLGFARWWSLRDTGFWHVLAGVILVALVALAWNRDALGTDLAATVVAAFLAGWTWDPCVGSELGDIITSAPFRPWSQLGPSLLYFGGLFIPLILLASIEVAVPKLGDWISHPSVRNAGLSIVMLVGALVSITLFDDLASELARRSSF